MLYCCSLTLIASDGLSGIEKESVKLYGHNALLFKWFPKMEPAKVRVVYVRIYRTRIMRQMTSNIDCAPTHGTRVHSNVIIYGRNACQVVYYDSYYEYEYI